MVYTEKQLGKDTSSTGVDLPTLSSGLYRVQSLVMIN